MPEPDPFATQFAGAFEAARSSTGECPDPETLCAYAEGELGPDETACVRRHVTLCTRCELAISRVYGTLSAGQAGEGARIRTMAQRIARILWSPAPAYAVAALLLVFAITSGQRPEPKHPLSTSAAATAAPARLLDLNAVRSEAARNPEAHAGDRVVLSMLIAPRSGGTYWGRITDERGLAAVPEFALTDCDELGNCYVVLDTRSLPASRYDVRISETMPGALGRELAFSFTLRPR